MTKIVGLKEFRKNIDKYANAVKHGESLTVVKRAKPIFKIEAPEGIRKNLDEYLIILKTNRNKLERDYKVKKMGIFGSTVRGDDEESSDVDILVEFKNPVGLFKFVELNEFLEKILGTKVDLATKRGLKPAIKSRVLKEVVYV